MCPEVVHFLLKTMILMLMMWQLLLILPLLLWLIIVFYGGFLDFDLECAVLDFGFVDFDNFELLDVIDRF